MLPPAASLPPPHHPRWWPFALAAIALLTLLLRLNHIHTHSLWLDDAYSLMLATGHGQAHHSLPLGSPVSPPPLITTAPPVFTADPNSFLSVITHQADDVHPPLYFLLLRAFYLVAPTHDPELARIPGIFFSAATAMILCLLARRLLPAASPLTHLLPGLLFALAPTQVFMALEVRGYSLASLLTLTTAYFGHTFSIRPTRTSLLLAALAALAALWTHYFTLFPLLGLFLWLLLTSPYRKTLLFTAAVTAAAFAVAWGPILYQQLSAAGRWDDWISLQPHQSPAPAYVLLRALAIPARLLADPLSQSPASTLISLLLLLIATTTAINTAAINARRSPILLPLFPLATTILGLAALDLSLSTLHVNLIRYAIPAAAFAALLPACLSLPNFRHLPHLIIGPLILYCMLFFDAAVQPRPDLRSLAHSLTTALNSSTPPIPLTTPVLIARPPGPTLEDDPQTLALMLAPYLPPGLPHTRPILLLTDTADLPALRPTLILTAYGTLPLPPDAQYIYHDPTIPAHIFLLP